jgi:hypothetical protein
MNARKPSTVSFRVVDGGRDLHRVPLVPVEQPSAASQIAACALVIGVLGVAAWAAAWVRGLRL